MTWTGLNTANFAKAKAQIEHVTYVADNHILVAVDEGTVSQSGTPPGKGGIWRGLEDGSGNWEWSQTLVQPAMTSVVVSPHDPNTVYAAASHVNFRSNNQWAGIYRSKDKGETWTYLDAPGLGSLSHLELYPSPHDPTKMYVGTWGGGLFVGEL